MGVVCPVGMFVYTAVYMLGADGAVFDTPEKKSMVRGTPKPKHPNHKKKKISDACIQQCTGLLLMGR